jgi:DNA-binding transcriptional LysR family regulator
MSKVELDLDLLRTFIDVVDAGSFSGAASRAFRSQAAVTQRVQRLEQVLQQPLFMKVGRRKVLTENGTRLLDYARRIMALHDEACASLTGSTEAGEIRLGAPEDTAEAMLPALLRRFTRTFPSVRVVIHVARSSFLMQGLNQGHIDIAISTIDDKSHPRVHLRSTPTVWLASADFKFARYQPLRLVLQEEPSLYRRLALDALHEAKVPSRIAHVSGSLVGVLAAVRAGLGVTARSIQALDPSMRVLGAAEGLPAFADVNLYAYLSLRSSRRAASMLFESLKDSYPQA